MNIKINRFLFSQTNIDSGSLTPHSTIVCKFTDPGEYQGIIMKGSGIVSRFKLNVLEERASNRLSSLSTTNSKEVSQISDENKQVNDTSNQINIDLSNIMSIYTLKKGDYAVFYVSTGAGGYSIEIYRFERGSQIKTFDSKELNDGVIFSAMVIRPGIYLITNTVNNAKADLVVNYPELGKMKKILIPINIEINAKEIIPNKININHLRD